MDEKERLTNLVRQWDEEILRQKIISKQNVSNFLIQGVYQRHLEYLDTLAEFRFIPFLNDDIQDFYGKFWIWLNQFETVEEQKLAFKIAANITFITEEQIRYLQEVCFQEKLKYRLLDEILVERKLPPYAYELCFQHLPEKLEECLIVPLTDSARYNQFVHINSLQNHSQLGLHSLSVLVHPDIRTTPEAVKKLRKRYMNKRVLVVIEDFCGSGKTITSDLARIAEHYDNFENIYFCPYVITEHAEKTISRYARVFASKIKFEILYGMRISERMRVFSESSVLFSPDEQTAIRALCMKYHKKHFSEHKFVGKYPFGYKNGQLLVVMQSNCPNHTLPIIWAYEKGWKPLFRRIQRYS